MIVSADVAELDKCVAEYEAAARQGSDADLATFLPPRESPLYDSALAELIRVEMELNWSSGRPRTADHYIKRFPEIRSRPKIREQVEFEERRLTEQYERRRLDDNLADGAAAYLRKSPSTAIGKESVRDGDSDSATRLFVELDHSSPNFARHLADALTRFPKIGEVLAGFHLLEELGRGAFSRVYLAREEAVDGRRVVVKLSSYAEYEVRALAKLRHSNIMPVYSVRHTNPFSVICMPYCGEVTLADVIRRLRSEKCKPASGQWLVDQIGGMTDDGRHTPMAALLSNSSYEDAVLRLASRMAEGLAHAHQRGICHRDLKPANTLLADDGEPQLLDFNLSTEISPGNSATAAMIGGTLPYMAPEQLRNFLDSDTKSDFRADVYSLGLVIFELLTGQPPVPLPKDSTTASIRDLFAARESGPLNVRERNPAVTPALAAIVSKCLHPKPEMRYADARELADDLDAQIGNRPLAHTVEPSLRERLTKWRRRHPIVTSSGSIAVVAGLALTALGMATVRINADRVAARGAETARLFADEFREAQILLAAPNPAQSSRGLAVAQRAWERYPDESTSARHQRGQLALASMIAEQQQTKTKPAEKAQHEKAAKDWARKAQAMFGEKSEMAGIVDAIADGDISKLPPRESATCGSTELAQIKLAAGKAKEALIELRKTTQRDPGSVLDWYLRGLAEQALGAFESARASFTTCIALDPQQSCYYHSRALCHLALKKHAEALADLNQAIRLNDESLEARLDRSIVRFESGENVGALDDVSTVALRGYPETRIWFLRARIWKKSNDAAGAETFVERGFALEPVTEADWLARSTAWLIEKNQPDKAMQDAEECARRFPQSRRAWMQKAHIFVDHMKRPADAIAALDEAIRIDDAVGDAFAGRGVIKARLGDFVAAKKDAERALAIADGDRNLDIPCRPDVIYQVAGIYALTAKDTPKDRDRAIDLLGRAIHQEYGAELVNIDPELESLRGLPEVRRLLSEANARKNSGNVGG